MTMLGEYLYFCFPLIVWTMSGLATAQSEDLYVIIGRCRLNCFQKLMPPSGKKDLLEECVRQPSCNWCWEYCFDLIASSSTYGPVCHDKGLCRDGCQTACEFARKKTNVSAASSPVKWIFPDPLHVDMNSLNVIFDWSEPLPTAPIRPSTPTLYSLFVKNNSGGPKSWKLITQQTATHTYVKRERVPIHQPHFKLLAIKENGTVAESIVKGDDPYVERTLIFNELAETSVTDSVPVETPIVVTQEIQFVGNRLNLVLRWQLPANVTSDRVMYDVNWFLDNCNYYEEAPYCDHPPDHYANTISLNKSAEQVTNISNLMFNSLYYIKVEYTKDPKNIFGDVFAITPRCYQPNVHYTECRDAREPPAVDYPDYTIYDPRSNSSSEAILRLNITSKQYKPDMELVEVNISWSFPVNNHSAVMFRLSWKLHEDTSGLVADSIETRDTHCMLRLLPDTLYLVQVEMNYKTDSGQVDTKYSDKVLLNTSDLSLSVNERPQAVIMNKKEDMRTLNGVIISVTCIATFIVLSIIALFIYKKRKSFKDIIITKTAVAKSNSYKSNVGAGKADYSNQLLVISDQWELDPRELKFSTPLGQGAFGKVVTGYYGDTKVAIKLIKEGAPISYKEDLVAEIALMKRIGYHPNIVAFIGACTLADPIALVMEFVPHGSMQIFLKKCRLEGDLRRRDGGPSEITYSMLQDHGGIENGVITPADMLSFARQVALAMEYLAEKKYVHRDLAARNVLLDRNKVVKVCDFGLSRDIYKDNQYKKLTNGKLPLKWMAIESLRDRVFTTQSDVWSFGILLWEIVTMGASPYPNIALADLYYVLSNGYRMEKPSNCSAELYRIMRQCWEENPHDRPTFKELLVMLEDLLTQDRDYLVLEDIDVPLNTSENSSIEPVMDLSSSQQLHSMGCCGPQCHKEPVTVDVCIHQKSTDRLLPLKQDDSDSSP